MQTNEEPASSGAVAIQNEVEPAPHGEVRSDNRSPCADFPAELKSLGQWAVYRTYLDKESGKHKKVIISPVTSRFSMSNDPMTWADYAQAKQYCEKYRYNGLVFALQAGITFIDLDHAADKATGEIISPEAKRLLELLPETFCERSVSGTGIHILLKGSLPSDALKRNDAKGIEMYDTRRFVCMTGNPLNGCTELKDYSDKIAQIVYEFVGRRQPPREYTVIPAVQSDTDLITQITNSKQGTKFQSLYGGDILRYPSHSNADSALIFMLAWWTQDPNQIDRIYRSSGLMREKWDSRRGAVTYGEQLIGEALSVVQPRKSAQRKAQEQY
jgi:putative DNA primase/helicase